MTHGDETLELTRDGEKLVVKQPAEHPPLDDYKLDDVDRGLELLTFQDVQTDKEPVGDKVGQSVFTTSDGLSGDGDGVQGREGHLGALRRHRQPTRRKDGGGQVERAARRMDLSARRLEAEGAGAVARRSEGAAAGEPARARQKPRSRERPRISRPPHRRHRDRGDQGRQCAAGAPRQTAQCRLLDAARRRAGARRDGRGGGTARAAGGDRPGSRTACTSPPRWTTSAATTPDASASTTRSSTSPPAGWRASRSPATDVTEATWAPLDALDDYDLWSEAHRVIAIARRLVA